MCLGVTDGQRESQCSSCKENKGKVVQDIKLERASRGLDPRRIMGTLVMCSDSILSSMKSVQRVFHIRDLIR